jgi:hypothetical protein
VSNLTRSGKSLSVSSEMVSLGSSDFWGISNWNWESSNVNWSSQWGGNWSWSWTDWEVGGSNYNHDQRTIL